jgi:putative nucleotidyltransferase with HDIG domain
MRDPLHLLAGVLATCAVGGAVVVASTRGTSLGNMLIVPLLLLAAVLAQRGRVRVLAGVEQSLALLPALCAAVLFGPLAAMLVAGGSMLAELRGPALKTIIYLSARAINGLAMGFAAVAGQAVGSSASARIGGAAIAAALTAEILDVGVAALVYRLRGKSARDVLSGLLPLVLIAVPIFATTVALLGLAYTDVSPWTLPMFLLPAVGMQQLFVLYQNQRDIAQRLAAANERISQSSLNFASALVSALDARDAYTAGHSSTVAQIARMIALKMRLDEKEAEVVYRAGLVHDIGKLALPPGLLEKPGALTLDERRVMETHAEAGSEILGRIEEFAAIAVYVRHHHERVDGRGYPDQIGGNAIPLVSRILAVADAFDAMTSNRPYRTALSHDEAIGRLRTARGEQFDAYVVDALVAILGSRTTLLQRVEDPTQNVQHRMVQFAS